MSPDDQPTIPTAPPNGSRPAPMGWQAPSVEEMQALLPQYEVLEILGRGGMGAVYKARQKSLKRLVAIKILPLDAADDEMKFAERFQNEAQTMAAMNHPAIVSVHDFGETPDGLLYFIMEFVDGTDVQKMIQASGRLSPEHALAITAHVCDALSYAHKRGVIHRDIKPANILIDQEGHIKVADFGLAKMHDPAQTSGLTKTNMAMGTPDYVAPEVLVTGMVADHRADIYAVGVMLYQMLTGEVPRGMFKLPTQKGVITDVRFDAIICKAMEQDREERYQSAMDVRRALDEIKTTPQAKDDGTGIVPVKAMPLKSDQRRAGVRSAASRPARAAFAIGGIVVVLAVAAFFVLRGKPEPAVVPASASSTTASKAGNLESWTDQLKARSWGNGWVLKEGELKAESKTQSAYFGRVQDGAVRVRLRDDPASALGGGPTLQLALRTRIYDEVTKIRGAYQFQIYSATGRCSLVYLAKDPNNGADLPPSQLWSGKSFPMNGGEAELEFRAEGDELSLRCGGNLIASVHDSRLAWGWFNFIASPGVLITKMETIGILPNGTSAAPQASTTTLPPIVNWQDVTATLRERARAMPEAVVEKDSIRPANDKSSARINAGTFKSPNFALKARFKSQIQLDLSHEGGHGFDFILSQTNQVIFNCYRAGAKKAFQLRPNVRHPDGFDLDQTHELIVTQQDGLIRAWLDDRFLGDARSDVPKEGRAYFTLVSPSELLSAAVAELPSTSVKSSALDETFLSAVAAASPDQQVALVVAKINEINHTEVSATSTITDGKVTAVALAKKSDSSADAPDISPVAVLKDLTSLGLMYMNVADISCLRELRLTSLVIHYGTFTDLTVLKEMPLTQLGLRGFAISDFSALSSKKLTRLDLGDCPQLKDLSFVKGMPLTYLRLDRAAVTDFSPIAGLPIEEIFFNTEIKLDAALLHSLPALKLINDKPVAEFGK